LKQGMMAVTSGGGVMRWLYAHRATGSPTTSAARSDVEPIVNTSDDVWTCSRSH